MLEKILKETRSDGQVVRLTLNAPKANVLDSLMMHELLGELIALRDAPEVKLIQLAAAGDHFSYGASVGEHTREKCGEMLTQFHALFFELADLSIPTCALVTGQCLGGAMELAAMCNFVFCDRSAVFGQPEILLGVFPPPASLILPMKVGQAIADELILTGRSLTAEEAERSGLVCGIFSDHHALELGVEEWIAKHILSKSAAALRFAVRAARTRFNRVVREELSRLQTDYVDRLMATHDANEGIQAFLEKRRPVWTSS